MPVIVACHGIGQVLVEVHILGQDGHHRKIVVAGRAVRPEPLHIRNSHIWIQFSMAQAPFPGVPGVASADQFHGVRSRHLQPALLGNGIEGETTLPERKLETQAGASRNSD